MSTRRAVARTLALVTEQDAAARGIRRLLHGTSLSWQVAAEARPVPPAVIPPSAAATPCPWVAAGRASGAPEPAVGETARAPNP